jgi:hypothetical protein
MRAFLVLALLLAGLQPAAAVTKTFTWTWPTVRTDGTALPLAQIGGITFCDSSVPVPGNVCGGTIVPCPATIPPATATGTCSANVISGHSFVAVTQDTASPPDVSAVSNSVTVPFTAPAAITDLKVQ